MLKRSLMTLKDNPLISILLIAAIVLSAASSMLLLKDTNRMMEISKEMTAIPADPDRMNIQSLTEMLCIMLKLVGFSLVTSGLGIVFIAGMGNMLAAAMNGGKASIKIFFFGIKKFFGKTLLSLLLFLAIIFGFSILTSIISIPFTVAGIVSKTSFDPEMMLGRQRITQIVISVAMIFLYPLVLLWLPAIFIDRNDGVVACFKNGVRAGVKKYRILVAVAAVLMLPTLVFYVVTQDIASIPGSPFGILMYIYQAIVIPVLLSFLFVLYQEIRTKQGEMDANNMLKDNNAI